MRNGAGSPHEVRLRMLGTERDVLLAWNTKGDLTD